MPKFRDTLLLVGSKESDRGKLREIFEDSYALLEAGNAEQALMFLQQNNSCVAAVVADIPLTEENAIRTLAAGAKTENGEDIPLMMLVDPLKSGKREETAFLLGATDVEKKPFTAASIKRRVQILLDLYRHKWDLERLVTEQSQTIRQTNQVMVDALSAIIEHRSSESGNHVLRIRSLSKILLEEVARNFPEYGLTWDVIDIIAGAAALHDIGKISIPDAILNKPGRLTPEEFEIMKTHTTVGSELIQNLSGIGDEEYLRYAYNISLYHHERWDGNGYPKGLERDEIPICAQVVGIVDAFDALTTKRVYKPALPYDKAISMIVNGECGVFSPRLIACFKSVRKELVELATRYADGYSPKQDSITVPLPGPAWKSSLLNIADLTQVKYLTLLHYCNDTVIEVDMDSKVYHMVYNPNPDFDAVRGSAPLSAEKDLIFSAQVHPDDLTTLRQMYDVLENGFFQNNLRKQTFKMRLYSHLLCDYYPYEITALRINTQNEEQRLMLLVLHLLTEELPAVEAASQTKALEGTVLRCTADDPMRIEDGAASLRALSGATEQELREQFQNQLSRLIVKEDLPQVYADMKEALLHGHSGETEFRIAAGSGRPLWVTDRFRLVQNADGTESVYHVLADNSRDKDALEKLRQVNERNQILIDRSGDIVFDWDLERDVLSCSDRWEARFGYPPISKNYSGQFGRATHFHPDDVTVMQELIRRLRLQPDVAKAEVRIASGDGKYLWNEIRATSLPDANGKIVRILGLIKDIDDLKRATLHLKERAERDPLTKLLNKASTQIFANEYLASRDADSLAALLILDLDNFKHINDRYGHLYGDTILSQIGSILKGLFRSHDIVGRIGGDEFLILLKDIPNEDLLRDRCDIILESIGSMLEKTIPELGGSCSIGAVLIPNHGDSYGELYKKADDALYLAKGAGKNQYCVYDPHEIMTEFLIDSSSGRATTSIDSDVQPGVANASFLQYIFKTLYESRNLEQSISDLLQYIGRQLNVSRAYIFENNEDNTLCNNTFEWCNDGIDPQINLLQGISYITDIPDYSKSFNEKGVFYCTDVSQLESHLREILEPQGIKSMLQCAIVDNGVFRGYVGFDECVSKRLWTQDQIDMLAFLAELLAVFLLKKRSGERIAEQAENLRRVLDLQDAWIYVIDPESCELKFLNAKTKKIAPEGDVGMVCHKVFMGRETRCENCPALMQDGQSSGQAEIHNGNYGLKVLAKATKLPWNGKESCLVTCTELE